MANYFIFKTDLEANRTTFICGGSHDDEHQCLIHWMSYMYGFMDGAFELLGRKNFQMNAGTHGTNCFIITYNGKNVEYFMLLGDEGHKLIQEISK